LASTGSVTLVVKKCQNLTVSRVDYILNQHVVCEPSLNECDRSVAAPITQPNLLPLLALLAVLVIIIVIVVVIKCPQYLKRPKSSPPKEFTDSPIYSLPDFEADGYTPVSTPSFTVDTHGVYHPIVIQNAYLRTSAVVAHPDGYNSDEKRPAVEAVKI